MDVRADPTRRLVGNVTDPRLDRLPKWARGEIERLTRDVAYWKAQASVGPEGSDTWAETYGVGTDKPLGKETQVRFDVTADRPQFRRNAIRARTRGDGGRRVLMVHADGPLLIQASASNVLHVWLA